MVDLDDFERDGLELDDLERDCLVPDDLGLHVLVPRATEDRSGLDFVKRHAMDDLVVRSEIERIDFQFLHILEPMAVHHDRSFALPREVHDGHSIDLPMEARHFDLMVLPKEVRHVHLTGLPRVVLGHFFA